jgi:long-chain fatty acid transport protein
MKTHRKLLAIGLALLGAMISTRARAQGYGSDTQNVLTPAAGGMAGVSVALPQDVPAAIFGNPATLTQFRGTQFTMGGAWVEGYPTVTTDGTYDHLPPYSVTSRTEGFTIPAIGVIQDLRGLGLPAAVGMGFSGLSGLGDEYRGRAPDGSFLNNLSNEYLVLGVNMAAAVEVTDRLSVGAALTLGNAFEQLGFIGPISSSAMVNDYALRGTVGIDYDLNPCNTLGFYYQSKMDFQFPNAIRFTNLSGTTYRDLNVDQPQTLGFGYANRSLMNGDLLIAADVYYKLWDNAALWQDVFVNQWAFAVGTQLTRGKLRYRLGYSYNSNPLNHNVGQSLDGLPVLQEQIQLFQAACVPFVNQHRLTGGIGCHGFLIPTLDLDLFAGGLFKGQDEFGATTQASAAAYYIGMGMTWRFGDCAGHADEQ